MHLLLALAALTAQPEASGPGPLVHSLWLIQRYGTPDALDPANDNRVKAALARALARDKVITSTELGGFMVPDTFNALAGPDDSLDAGEVSRALSAATPESRAKLNSELRSHA